MNVRKVLRNSSKTAGLLACCVFSSGASALGNPVDYVDVRNGGININNGKVEVKPVNGNYSHISSGNTVSFSKEIKAGCKGSSYLKIARIFFGHMSAEGKIVESAGDAYYKGVPQANVVSIPYTNVNMAVPVNKIGFSPAQICQSMLQTKINQGQSKAQVMSQDFTVFKPIKFSGVAACAKPGKDWHYKTDYLNDTMRVVCKAAPKPSIPMAPLKGIKANTPNIQDGPGEINAGYQPLVITQANILAETLNYTGSCPKNLKFTVRIKGQGKGGVKYSVLDNGSYIHNGVNNTFEQNGDWWQEQFTFKVNPGNINQLVNHKFTLKIQYRDSKAQGLSWKPFNDGTELQWSHKCTPQAKFQMGSPQGNGGINYNNPKQASQMKIAPEQISPEPQKPARVAR